MANFNIYADNVFSTLIPIDYDDVVDFMTKVAKAANREIVIRQYDWEPDYYDINIRCSSKEETEVFDAIDQTLREMKVKQRS